ncbi:MAG: metallophosphoesterase [Thiobacillus sp.]|nr:metallophosphoesterase [Thiobacillus sp.]
MSAHLKVSTLVLALGLSASMSSALAAPWSFGIISDTQWSPTGPVDQSVAIHVIDQVNQQFINQGVDLVLQVGDLTDDGKNNMLDVRAAHNQALSGAGIEFYPVRGNHEGTSTAAAYMNTAFPGLSGYSTPYAETAGLTYAFTHNNTKFMLLDTFTLANGTTKTVGEYQSWINTELAAADHEQAFVFTHKNLLGQNHKDNMFGSSNDANPDMQNDFLASMEANNVKYVISGHDHNHTRSLVTSPDGQSQAHQLITASDSYKFYTPKAPYSDRETPFAQELYQVGYYVVTVDGPRVTFDHYASPKWWALSDGSDGSPTWTKRESFGYSLNGKEFVVAPGGYFDGVADNSPTGSGWVGTEMAILDGMNATYSNISGNRATSQDVNTGWTSRTEAGGNLASDVLSLWGMADTMGSEETDIYVLSMSYDPSEGAPVFLATRDANGNWVNAVELNFGGAKTFVAGAYSGQGLGSYGIDEQTHTAWAVLNHGSDFAVAAVPEPETYALMLAGLGLVGLVARRRRAQGSLN